LPLASSLLTGRIGDCSNAFWHSAIRTRSPSWCIGTAGWFGPKAQKAMPTLLNGFKRVDQETQVAIVTTWTKMGSAARDALPVLYQLLANTEKTANNEETRKLRQAASAAIKAISE
jgi:hypothetical protein